ncbi:MAG TPA: hypothetical protein VJ022_07280 [Anaerolineales bacterium]|nr:hypothetical protein [Anaerolineales bacterium]
MTIPFEILELWGQHSSAAFPEGYGDKEVNGIDLPLLDAEIASCIQIFVHHNGNLDSRHVKTLRKCLVDLNTIVLLLNSAELIYFDRLRKLANLVIQEAEG